MSCCRVIFFMKTSIWFGKKWNTVLSAVTRFFLKRQLFLNNVFEFSFSQFCSLFFGSVLPPSSQVSTQPVTSQQVLASDSEDDSEV